METLDNKLALVTGSSGVLGAAIVRSLIGRGCRVLMADIVSEPLDALAGELGDKAIPLMLDVSDDLAVAKTAKEIRDAWGDVDILVNNAGILSNNKAVETSPEEWRRLMSINLDGAFFLSREWLAGMKAKGWGRIVNICSLAAKTGGLTAGTAYTTSKGGMTALTFSLAREAAGFGVTANGVSPAYIKTPMVTEQLSEEQRQKLLNDIPVGRFCDGEEVAHVVDFLVSPLSGFITGEIIDINGGLHLD
ncbi:MAG: SDR family oxidoreductase [Rhodospirillaceae bacterium]|jgi:3-oxoacyl-[acyl-carrier protein] reductase|nr:SDR family oxidoreductase [Rhodospirillaceae bacterium]MBT7356990.1 SDR family oxidoreductase [Rhodospirillaceae bacterium]